MASTRLSDGNWVLQLCLLNYEKMPTYTTAQIVMVSLGLHHDGNANDHKPVPTVEVYTTETKRCVGNSVIKCRVCCNPSNYMPPETFKLLNFVGQSLSKR